MSDPYSTATSPVEPQRSSRRRVPRSVRWALASSALIAVVLSSYCVAVGIAEMPPLAADLNREHVTEVSVDGETAQAVVDAQQGITAIGWAHDDEVWSNDESLHPIASLVKLVTVLVCLEKQPLGDNADESTYIWTEADVRRQNEIIAMSGAVVELQEGTELTQYQMLQLILMESANNVAAAYANQVFGDNERFLEAAKDFADTHALTSLTVVDPTGLDMGNQATAADMVKLARIVLQNPTITEITSTKTAEMPWGVGTITNTNPLLGELPGIIGVKTGALDGYNLIVAQQEDALGRQLTKIAVTLQQPSRAARAESGAATLAAMASLPQPIPFFSEGEQIGTVTTWQGDTVNLVTVSGIDTVLLPAETATSTVNVTPITAGKSGQKVGEITVTSPGGTAQTNVVTSSAITEPAFWWRFTHPAVVFGWV